ncbi:MAG: hypothetical protein ACLSVS_00325, partial [Parasutterella excrementihominis]
GVKNWYKGECDLIPGKTAPLIHVIDRDYRTIYDKYTSIGPLLSTNGGGNRGIKWNLDPEITELCQLNGTVQEGVAKGRPKMETDINAANFILRVSPETNGALSFRSWSFVKDQCGVDARDTLPTRSPSMIWHIARLRPSVLLTGPVRKTMKSRMSLSGRISTCFCRGARLPAANSSTKTTLG